MVGSPIENVLSKLHGVRQINAANWKGLCPAHPDNSPSLDATEFDNGNVGLICRTGCKTQDVVHAMGLTMADLFKESRDQRRGNPPKSEWYPYRDADGVLRYYKKRFYKWDDGEGDFCKTFVIVQTNKSTYGLPPGQSHLLYRLPEVIAAVEAGETIYVVEGEKDADALVRAGVCATSGDGGAANWSNVADIAAKVLIGATVVVVADRDDAGYKCARDVVATLEGVAECVSVVVAAIGKDAADHLGAGQTVDEFIVVADGQSVGEWIADDDAPADTPSQRVNPPIDWEEFFSDEIGVEWLVEDVWPIGRQVHVHAKQKSGKSIVTLWIAASLASGYDPFSGATIVPVFCSYFDFEMSYSDLRERIEDMGFTKETLANLRYHLMPVLPPLDTEAGGRKLLEEVHLDGSSAVFIDTLSRVVEGDENSNDTYIKLFAYTGTLLKREGIGLWRLDHEGLESGRSRGASAKGDDVDIVYQLKALDSGYQLVNKAARIAWIPQTFEITRTTEPLKLARSTAKGYVKGTAEKAAELDAVGAPVEITHAAAKRLLKAHGITPGRNEVLLAAISYRKQSWLFGLGGSGNVAGNAQSASTGT